jgi:hypothetical protein
MAFNMPTDSVSEKNSSADLVTETCRLGCPPGACLCTFIRSSAGEGWYIRRAGQDERGPFQSPLEALEAPYSLNRDRIAPAGESVSPQR